MVPAFRVQHFGGGFGVLVIALQKPRRAHQDFPRIAEFDFDTVAGHAHGIGPRLVVGLQADEHRRLGGPVELLQVDPDGPVEAEQIGADGFARGVGHPHPAHAQVVAQGAIHQPVAQTVLEPIQRIHGLPIHEVRSDPTRQTHESVEHPALDGTGILHADHDAGQHALEHARRREVVGGPHLLQVDVHGAAAFRAIDEVAGHQPLGVGKDVLSDPGRGQVGQHLVINAQFVEAGARGGAIQEGAVAVHHALGVPGGAAGEEHGGHVVRLADGHLVVEQARMLLRVGRPGADQIVQALQAGLIVVAQTPWLVVPDALKLRALLANFEHLVDLLLILHHAKAHLRVVDRVHALGRHRVLVQGHRDRPQGLSGQHGRIQARSIRADDHQMLAAAQSGLRQAAGQISHQLRHVRPAHGLPDAVLLLAHRRALGVPGGLLQKQSRESVLSRHGLCSS